MNIKQLITGYWMVQKRNQERNKSSPVSKWEWKHNPTKPLRVVKSSSKRDKRTVMMHRA